MDAGTPGYADVQMGKGIDVISVVSTFLALTSSNRDRRRVNIAVLALSWGASEDPR